jgi:hypothetical protein
MGDFLLDPPPVSAECRIEIGWEARMKKLSEENMQG